MNEHRVKQTRGPFLRRRNSVNRSALLVLSFGLLVAASLCGCDAQPQSAQERAIVVEIRYRGGEVALDESRPNNPVVAVYLRRLSNGIDDILNHLKDLKELQSLDLTGAAVTDAQVERLKGLTQLRSLNLTDARVTDAGLDHLKGLSQLQRLSLFNTQVTDAGLERLKRLWRLELLWLRNAGYRCGTTTPA